MTTKQIYLIKTLQRQGGVITKRYKYLGIIILLSATILICGCSEPGNEIIENKDGKLTQEELAPYEDKYIETNLTVTKLIKTDQMGDTSFREFYETSDPNILLVVYTHYEAGGSRIPPVIKRFNQSIHISDGRVRSYEEEHIGQSRYYVIWI